MAVTFSDIPRHGRKLRRPQHRFQLRTRPWQIQPCLIAPVLPGETMRNLLFQSRAVTDPIKHPLVGWWYEMYVFYVKHRDLHERDHFTAMMLDPEYDLSSQKVAANTYNYTAGGSVDWVGKCLRRVVEEYFRDEGEAWDQYKIGDLPVASINQDSLIQSLINDDAFAVIQDEDVDADADGTITAGEVDAALRMYQFQRANNLTDMTYEDFLATYGIRQKAIELHKPELVRYVREWQYPSNTINPADGSAASAVSWAVSERADKDRFFTEPGFLFGVQVVRPKVYLSKQNGYGAAFLNDALSWLPAIMREDPYTSLKRFTAGTGAYQSLTDDYWLDVRDLLIYGDQFINFATSDTGANSFVALPTNAGQYRYASATDADALFSVPATNNLVRSDGVFSLQIASAESVDNTPRSIAAGSL